MDTGELTLREEAMLRELKRHEERLAEIERRRVESLKIKKENNGEPERIDKVLKSKFDYTFAVVNKSHRMLNPPGKRAAFRILGLFKHQKEFENWMEELHETNMIYMTDGQMKCKLGDLHKLRLLNYMLIPKNSVRERDAEYTEEKIEDLKKIHVNHLKMSMEEFEKHHIERSQGQMGLSLEKQCEKAKEKRNKSSRYKAIKARGEERERREDAKEVARVTRMMELRGQKFAIIIILMDVSKDVLAGKDDAEPAVLIIDCLDTLREAEEYMGTLKNYVFYTNIFIVDMYEWLAPDDIVMDEINEKYRNPEQDRLMREKKNQKYELEKYEKEQELEGKEIKAIEVTKESKAPENFEPLKGNPTEFHHVESSEPVDRAELEREEEERLRDYSKFKKGAGFNFST